MVAPFELRSGGDVVTGAIRLLVSRPAALGISSGKAVRYAVVSATCNGETWHFGLNPSASGQAKNAGAESEPSGVRNLRRAVRKLGFQLTLISEEEFDGFSTGHDVDIMTPFDNRV